MRDVYVAGIGITTFTRLEYPLAEIAAYPSMLALTRRRDPRRRPRLRRQHGECQDQQPDGAGQRGGRHAQPHARRRRRGRERPGVGSFGHQGRASLAVASGLHDVVLVTGAERMREVNNLEATDFVATLTHPLAEYIYGVTLPAHAAMFTRLYMKRYGVTERHLAMVAVKNQNDGDAQ